MASAKKGRDSTCLEKYHLHCDRQVGKKKFPRAGFIRNFSSRHPFARLASVYYQKFVELKDHKAWGPLIRSVVRKYRPNPIQGDPTLATPSEFLSFILDDLKKRGAKYVDQHWRPQHLSCPFCSLDFTVYAHMEELSEDSAYFFTKVELTRYG